LPRVGLSFGVICLFACLYGVSAIGGVDAMPLYVSLRVTARPAGFVFGRSVLK
jgi:hypothetical protein